VGPAAQDDARVGVDGAAPGAARGRRVGPLAVVRAVGHEVAAVAATVRRTSLVTWLGYALLLGAAATVGALPLGWFAFVLQVVGFAFVSLMVVWPEGFAHSMRTDDAFEVRERDSAAVVTYLPVAVAAFALPIYLLAQATLFWRVMRHVPGVLVGSGWGDAWRLSVDNLLFTELFLDLFDVFGIGFAQDPPGLAGRLLVFATRLLLSVGFVRVALSLVRAGFYRAHGLGRGADTLAELEGAVADGDAVRVRHLGRQVRDDATGTVDALLERLQRPDLGDLQRRDAYRGLRGLRDWAIPHLDARILHGDPRAKELEPLVADLRAAWHGPEIEAPRRRPRLALALALVALVGGALVVWAPAPLAFAVGVAAMATLSWLLASPRAAYEAAMERGVVPFVPLARLRGAVLWSSAWLASAFLLVSWATLWHASALWPGSFEGVGAEVGPRSLLGFVGASLVRVQATLSLPDVFGFAEPAVAQRPWVGSLLTFVLRTGLNLGFVAVVVTALQVRRDAQGFAGLVQVPDELAMRVEALRGGRYAFPLVVHHDLAVREALWGALDGAERQDVQEALAGSGAFEWTLPYDSLGAPASGERLRSQSVVVEEAQRRRWGTVRWGAELDAALAAGPWPDPIRAQVLARRAAMAVRDAEARRGVALFQEARSSLPSDAVREDGACDEATAVWALSVARSVGSMGPVAADDDVLALSRWAADKLDALVQVDPDRFAVDAMRFGIVRAVAVASSIGADAAGPQLGAVVDTVLALPRHHPWRESLVVQAVVAATALPAMVSEGGAPSASVADLEARLLEDLERDGVRWSADDLAVRAYDERLGEEVAQAVYALAHRPASRALWATAARAAAVFEARYRAGVAEARGTAIGLWWFASSTAHALGAHDEVLTATDAVVRLGDGMRIVGSVGHLVANAHAVRAQTLRVLGDDEAAFTHAATARSRFATIGASDWDGAAAAVAQGAVLLEGFEGAEA
jgi:hypothetical protein